MNYRIVRQNGKYRPQYSTFRKRYFLFGEQIEVWHPVLGYYADLFDTHSFAYECETLEFAKEIIEEEKEYDRQYSKKQKIYKV